MYTVCNHSSWNFCSFFSKLMSCYWFIFCLSYIFKTIKIKSPCKENNKVRIVIDRKIYCPFLNVAILDYSYCSSSKQLINTSDVKDYLEIHALQILTSIIAGIACIWMGVGWVYPMEAMFLMIWGLSPYVAANCSKLVQGFGGSCPKQWILFLFLMWFIWKQNKTKNKTLLHIHV